MTVRRIDSQVELKTSVVVPTLQSLVAGSLSGCVSWSSAIVWKWTEPAAALLLGWSAGAFILYIWMWSRWRSALDQLLGIEAKEPSWSRVMALTSAVVPTRIRIEERRDSGPYLSVHWVDVDFDDLGISYEKMVQVADAVIHRGASFGTNLAGGRPLTRTQFSTLRDELFVPREWAVWNNPDARAQGCQLTRVGRCVLKAIATSPSNL